MRLRLFDRIRWLAHPRRPPADPAGASGAQGRHRRGRRRGPATAPASPSFPGGPGSQGGPDPVRGHAPASGEWSRPGGPPGELAHTASPWPDSSPVSEAPGTPAAPGAQVQPGRGPITGWAEPAGTPRRPRCAPGRLGRGSVRRPRMPPRSAWARPRDQCQQRARSEDALVRNGGAGPGAVLRSQPVGYPGGRAGPGRGRRPASAGRDRAIFLAARRIGLARRAAFRGCASPGTAAGRGRPQELRLARGHLVAAVGPGVAAVPGSGGGRRPAGRTSRADQGKAGRRPRRDLHRPRRRPGTR